MEHTCIFCKIANGEIPSLTIYEDDQFRAILDINPASKGHTLIMPKKHFANIYELGQKETEEVFVLAKKIAEHFKDVLECDGINILQNNGDAAGQTVYHFHLHIIPRYKADQVGLRMNQEKDVLYDLNEVCEQIRLRLCE